MNNVYWTCSSTWPGVPISSQYQRKQTGSGICNFFQHAVHLMNDYTWIKHKSFESFCLKLANLIIILQLIQPLISGNIIILQLYYKLHERLAFHVSNIVAELHGKKRTLTFCGVVSALASGWRAHTSWVSIRKLKCSIKWLANNWKCSSL